MGISSQNGRKYGDAISYPVPVWSGVLEIKHFKGIGRAIWVFLWLLDKITKEAGGFGIVLGGRPIKVSEIAETFGMAERTARAHIDRLRKGGYVLVKHAPYGLIINVRNSMKFGIWKASTRSDRTSRPEDQRSEELCREVGKKTARGRQESSDAIKTQQDAAQDAAVGATPTPDPLNPWKILGVDCPMGSPSFQKIFEQCHATRNGHPLSSAMERAIQQANKQGVKVPPPFFEAKRKVEHQEAEELATHAGREIPELEATPWGTSTR